MPDSQVIVGDCIEVMRGMEAGSVQCCVTSPPYWGLRDYGTAEWEGGDKGCEHSSTPKAKPRDLLGSDGRPGKNCTSWSHRDATPSVVCKCGARRIDQQIGLEPTPEAYIAKMVAVFAEVKRVLRDDGVLFLNMGDCYASQGERKHGGFDGRHYSGLDGARIKDQAIKGQAMGAAMDLGGSGLKPKDLCMMPSRLALALQADGWWIRSMMPWVKRSAMPESCTDRPTSAIEYVFLLTKSKSYYWDADAVRVKAALSTHMRDKYSRFLEKDGPQSVRHDHETIVNPSGRNYRNSDLFYESLRLVLLAQAKAPHGMICVGDEPVALDVNPEAFKQAHFATFPRKLVAPLLKAATSEKGACPECGAPWKRVVETSTEPEGLRNRGSGNKMDYHTRQTGSGQKLQDWKDANPSRTIGWEPGCGCCGGLEAGDLSRTGSIPVSVPPAPTPTPCTVFDPFCGSGTVGVVAKQLDLSFIGIELNIDYACMAEARIANPEPEPVVPDVEGQRMLFEEK